MKKSHTRKILNLSACADSNTDTKKGGKSFRIKGASLNKNAALISVSSKASLTPPPNNFGTFDALFQKSKLLELLEHFW